MQWIYCDHYRDEVACLPVFALPRCASVPHYSERLRRSLLPNDWARVADFWAYCCEYWKWKCVLHSWRKGRESDKMSNTMGAWVRTSKPVSRIGNCFCCYTVSRTEHGWWMGSEKECKCECAAVQAVMQKRQQQQQLKQQKWAMSSALFPALIFYRTNESFLA